MRTWNNDARFCAKPDIIASRLTSMRNIYLRQELSTISNQIQKKYKERLPALHLVSIAAYEQVFNRQPLSLPEELRREAVKYGRKYYELNIEKLRMTEAENGLCPNHDRQSCSDKKCPLHQPNTIASSHDLSEATETDENQSHSSDSQRSISSKKSKSEQNSNGSPQTNSTSENTFNTTDTDNIAASVSSHKSSTIPTTTSTFSDTNTSYSSTDTSRRTSLSSSSTNPSSKSASNRSMRTNRINRPSASKKKLSRKKPPKIIIRRPSVSSLASKDTKNSSKTFDHNKLSVRRPSSKKRKRKRKRRKKSKKYKK